MLLTKSGKRLAAELQVEYRIDLIEAIEAEAAAKERERIAAVIREKAEYEWDTTYSAADGISVEKLLTWLESITP